MLNAEVATAHTSQTLAKVKFYQTISNAKINKTIARGYIVHTSYKLNLANPWLK